MLKEGKSLSGKALHLHLWKAFWPIRLTSPLSRLKVIFLIFHTSLPPCSSLHVAVLGNPLKRAVRLLGKLLFPPLGTYPLHFLEIVGVALQYDAIFLLQNELYFHAVFHTFDRAQMSNSWMHIKTWIWKDRNNFSQFVRKLSSDIRSCI